VKRYTLLALHLDGKKWDGIYVGRRKGKDLVYAGKVDHDFTPEDAKDLQERLKPLIRKTQPYSKKTAHRRIWVEPCLSAEIEYRAKSAEGKLRHPFFKGVRMICDAGAKPPGGGFRRRKRKSPGRPRGSCSRLSFAAVSTLRRPRRQSGS